MEISTSTYLRGWQFLSVTVVSLGSYLVQIRRGVLVSPSGFITYKISGVAEEIFTVFPT